MTVVVRARIRDGAWVDQSDIFRVDQQYYNVNDFSHYGCRFLFDPAGNLFFTIGDRGRAADAQDLSHPNGKIHRVKDDGSTPADNPFVGKQGAWPSIFSYGNRHVQGLQYHPTTGQLWATEHGPRGGDELNLVVKGANYGYPIVSNGNHYDGKDIPDHDTRPEFAAPKVWWTPVISPSSLIFYTGKAFPDWQGDAFAGGLSSKALVRIEFDGDKARCGCSRIRTREAAVGC